MPRFSKLEMSGVPPARCAADPRKVPEAVCLSSLTYHEAWELSYFGANVLHPRTTLPAMKYDIPIVLRNFFNLGAPGTHISSLLADQRVGGNQVTVKGFATIDNVTLISVEVRSRASVFGRGRCRCLGLVFQRHELRKQCLASLWCCDFRRCSHRCGFLLPAHLFPVHCCANYLHNCFQCAAVPTTCTPVSSALLCPPPTPLLILRRAPEWWVCPALRAQSSAPCGMRA